MNTIQMSSFMSRVDTSGDCWNWTGPTNENGYGRGYDPKRKVTRYAHRLSFEQFHGWSPEEIMHTCDNRKCVNPAHLKGGTHRDNVRDMAIKGRGNTARLTPEAVLDIRANFKGGVSGNSRYFQDLYGVSRHTVRSAALGKTWGDLK